jgi:hypothetical protein
MLDRKKTLEGQDSLMKITSKKQIPKHNYFTLDEPYDLAERFRNMENALKFIENPTIRKLEKDYFELKNDIKKEQDAKSDFSKAIYKKVIARDNDYNFQHQIESNEYDISDEYNQRHSEHGHKRQIVEKAKKEDLLRKFKHGGIASTEEKRERLREESEIPLNFRHVKAIETPEFDRLKDVEFWQLIRGEGEEKEFGHSGGNDFDNLAIQSYIDNFKHNLIT